MKAEKKALRTYLRRRRCALDQARVVALSSALIRHVISSSPYRRSRAIGLYQSVDNEVDPSSLLLDAQQRGKTVFLPIVERESRRLIFRCFRVGDPLRKSPFGIPEPDWPSPLPKPDSILGIDLFCLPLVGFGRDGLRLGYGGGYFDRTLAALPFGAEPNQNARPVLMGLAYGFQEIKASLREPHDVPLDFVATEEGVFKI